MLERFTPKARMVLVTAETEAKGLGHGYIGTEHVLLGLLAADGVGRAVLGDLGLTLDDTRGAVVSLLAERATTAGPLPKKVKAKKAATALGHVPFTPRAKSALELGLREALDLGHNYIGTEHLLLGVGRQEGLACDLLAQEGITYDDLRTGVVHRLGTLHGDADQRTADRRRGRMRRRITPDDEISRTIEEAPPSHEVLLGVLADERSVAAKALAKLGVDLDAVRQAIADVDVAGTSDEPSWQAFARTLTVTATGSSVEMRFESLDVADEVRRIAGEDGVMAVGAARSHDHIAELHDALVGGLRRLESVDSGD